VSPEDLRDEIIRDLSAFLAMSHDSVEADHSGSAGNPIDVEWRRAMDDLRRQEEEDMKRGTYNYGFQPINNDQAPSNPFIPDWQSSVGGGG